MAAFPALRRVGASLAQLPRPASRGALAHVLRGLAWSFASEEPQEVDYAELEAFLAALQLTRGHLVFITDDKKVEQGWYNQRWLSATTPPAVNCMDLPQ